MSFGKSLGYSLVLFVALNFVFAIIAAAIGGTIDTFFSGITEDPLGILLTLFAPILLFPGLSHISLILGALLSGELGGNLSFLLVFIGYIASPLIAALVGGKMAETKGEAFGAWLVTMFISAGALIVVSFIGQDISASLSALGSLGLLLGGITGVGGDVFIIGYLLLMAYLNGVFYSAFAMLTSGMDYY